jgi:alginate O-acetyltransferase complex protein AlgI
MRWGESTFSWLFITFFPHLVAGPIVRPRDFLPQIRRRKQWYWLRVQVGLQLILTGMFKKMVIADHMAQFVDPIFANPCEYSTLATWLAVLAYALQIYGDFSGYSDMALGTAHMFGYHLAQNFNMPYLSRNVAEFWHRWHISLSTWLRDYLFIPLGGSRGSSLRTCRNLLITMILGGLWHGASWTFIVWGLFHGVLLIAHRGFQAFCTTRPGLERIVRTPLGTTLCVALTLLCVCVGWVFFRSTSFDAAETILMQMATVHPGKGPPLSGYSLAALAAAVALSSLYVTLGGWHRIVVQFPAPAWGCAYALLMVLTLALAPEKSAVFIYFQF